MFLEQGTNYLKEEAECRTISCSVKKEQDSDEEELECAVSVFLRQNGDQERVCSVEEKDPRGFCCEDAPIKQEEASCSSGAEAEGKRNADGPRRRRPQEKTCASPSGLQVHAGLLESQAPQGAPCRPHFFRRPPTSHRRHAEVKAPHSQPHTHTGERPYSCSVCGKAFNEKSNLATHMRKHTGERPHSCNVCCKAFSKKSTLTTHMFTHTGDRPFSCDVCGEAVINKSHLAYHMRVHTGKRLDSCSGKAFSHKSTLTSHMRTHSGERPHSCSVCGKAFSKKSNLTSHMRTH